MITIYSRILDLFTHRQRRQFWVLLVLVVLAGLLEVISIGALLPFLGLLSDPDIIQTSPWYAWAYTTFNFSDLRSFQFAVGLGAFFAIIFGLIIKGGTFYILTRFATMTGFTISSRLLQGYLHQPYVWFLNHHSADLGKSVLEETNRMVSGLILPAMQITASLALACALIVFLVLVEPVAALATAGIMVLAYGTIFLALRNKLKANGLQTMQANEGRFRIAQEAMGGVKDVKLMGLENTYIRLFNTPAHAMARLQADARLLAEMPRFVLEAVAFGATIIILLMLLLRADNKIEEVIPVIGFFAFAGLRLFPAMQDVYRKLAVMRAFAPLLERLHGEMQRCWEDQSAWRKGTPPAPRTLTRDIRLQEVSYSYPGVDRAVLDALSLTIPSGSKVALVGGTGAGKTTAIDIILGLLRPTAGQLVVDGDELGADALWSWQRSMGYVPQQIFLIDDTIAANIAFGVPKDQIDMEAVVRAAKAAELDGFINRDLNQGYETSVGERGVRLSGGQRQRIGIARALYYNPSVLILDEATSALDNATEATVMKAIHNLGADKTVIMIAHRLSTVEACDIIFYLEKGKVAAQGTYQELLAASPGFRAMAEAPTQAAS